MLNRLKNWARLFGHWVRRWWYLLFRPDDVWDIFVAKKYFSINDVIRFNDGDQHIVVSTKSIFPYNIRTILYKKNKNES
jgi:hypothetical protein